VHGALDDRVANDEKLGDARRHGLFLSVSLSRDTLNFRTEPVNKVLLTPRSEEFTRIGLTSSKTTLMIRSVSANQTARERSVTSSTVTEEAGALLFGPPGRGGATTLSPAPARARQPAPVCAA